VWYIPMRKGRCDRRFVSGRRKPRDFWPVVPEHIVSDQELHACIEGDVDVPPCACPFD
jgi:hypothetical protein